MRILNMSEAKDFILHPQLDRDSVWIADLDLSRVLLMNNALFPWIILVPKRPEKSELIDLSSADQHQLLDEMAFVSHKMKALFVPDKLNIATLGNQVAQLHIHIIARFKTDAAWPNPVWGKGQEPYKQSILDDLVERLKASVISH